VPLPAASIIAFMNSKPLFKDYTLLLKSF